MIDPSRLAGLLREAGLERWADLLPGQLQQRLEQRAHGDWPAWRQALAALPKLSGQPILNAARVGAIADNPLDPAIHQRTKESLMRLHPWRKGPYDLLGVEIDSEWRSDWKWQRLERCIAPLNGRRVLDVGCGNGYHCWRMIGAGARLVIGIDPTQLYLAQFLAVRHFLGDQWPIHLLPLAMEDVPPDLQGFDSVFSMGVLYHRRSPMDHLLDLKGCLRPGGELILETLVIEGRENEVLLPRGRYAKMRNVWFIPSAAALCIWLARCGFENIGLIDTTPTSRQEQRTTEWMRFESLGNFLHPQSPGRTIEGYPAPRRALLRATAPDR